LEGLPPFTGGLVGYFSFDYLGYSEPSVRTSVQDTEKFKDVDLMLFDKVIAFDNIRQKIILIVNISLDNPEANYNKAKWEIKQLSALLRTGEKSDEPGLASEYDDMLPQAVDVALEVKQVSVSMLQRRLKLGYSRAARIVDQMEELGIVGPYEGAKPRQVIVDREGWKEIEVSMGLISDADMDLALDMQDDGEDLNYSDEEN
jgi:DNA segregation ATPase FtsK/SpoIIIE-like protein